MVSTRKRIYKSPPRVERSPRNDAKNERVVKKLFNHATSDEKLGTEDCQTEETKPGTISSAKKKNDSQNSSCDSHEGSLFVIDKTPSQFISNSPLRCSISESSATSDGENKFDADCDKRRVVTTMTVEHDSPGSSQALIEKIPSSSEKVTVDSSEDVADEVYEIDMSCIASAADDTIKLRMEADTDEIDSDSSVDGDEAEIIDSCLDQPGTSKDHFLDNSVHNKDITNSHEIIDVDDDDEDNQCMETAESESAELNSDFFIIDKGPSSFPATTSDSELFVIDKGPINQSPESHEDSKVVESSSSEESDSDSESKQRRPSGYNLSSRIKCPINPQNMSYINFHPLSKHPQQKTKISAETNRKVEELMKKSVLKPGFERQQFVEPITGKRQQKREGRAERAKTKGAKWFDMPAPEMTPELKNDLTVVQMRRALDPKRFYKGNDMEALPKYFQMGRVVETAADFYDARVPKKQRKANLVEELLADAEFRNYNKRKYAEIQEKTAHHSRGAYKHMKRLKKKKK